jgi:hypothetical protein
MPIGAIVVNKFTGKGDEADIVMKAEAELGKPVRKIPFLEQEPVGMDSIQKFTEYLKAEEWLPKGKNDD